MRRKDREMDEAFALGIADKCEYAVLSMTDGGGAPYCVPISIARDGRDIFFHCAREGKKVDAMRENPEVCIACVGDTRPAADKFTTEFESAIIRGRAEEVLEDAQKIRALRLLCERYTPANMHNFDAAVNKSLARTGVWRVAIREISGKRKKYDSEGKEMKFGRTESMVRKIIRIDEEKCNGCGACAAACHEGAIGMVDGRAKLLRDDYCDGLGDCLPACPTGAITFEEREAAAYDESAVLENKRKSAAVPGGCLGSRLRRMERRSECETAEPERAVSQLGQWPCQLKLVPVNAPYFEGARLLIAADCTAFAYANLHREFMKGKITLIGCPKLDSVDYSEKLTEIIKNNDIQNVTIVRMEVPCCGGLELAAKKALQASGKLLPWQVVTISADGRILD